VLRFFRSGAILTLSAYEEEVFALIVADVEAVRGGTARRSFLALGAVIVALAFLFLPSHAGWAPTHAFVLSYAGGAAIALTVGPRLFRRHL
jgi:hypothetical protein